MHGMHLGAPPGFFFHLNQLHLKPVGPWPPLGSSPSSSLPCLSFPHLGQCTPHSPPRPAALMYVVEAVGSLPWGLSHTPVCFACPEGSAEGKHQQREEGGSWLYPLVNDSPP